MVPVLVVFTGGGATSFVHVTGVTTAEADWANGIAVNDAAANATLGVLGAGCRLDGIEWHVVDSYSTLTR